MNFLENQSIEIDTFIGTKIQLSATLLLLEEAAQLYVCDSSNQLNNLICTMNLFPEVSAFQFYLFLQVFIIISSRLNLILIWSLNFL